MQVTPGTLDAAGPAVVVLHNVLTGQNGEAFVSAADDGTLVYVPATAPPESTPVWVDRAGVVTATGLPQRPYRVPRVSPNGRMFAANILTRDGSDIWIAPTDGATLERFTFGRRGSWQALAFSRDSTQLAYAEDAQGASRLVTQSIDRSGPSRELVHWKLPMAPSQWLSKGEAVLVNAWGPDSGGDLLVVRSSGNSPPTPVVQEAGHQFGGTLSADERFMAYVSDETGRSEVFATPFPGAGNKRQLTSDGGTEPIWSPTGKEIFYRVGDRMMALPVTTTPSLVVGPPRLLFEGRFVSGPAGEPAYDVAPDGRFLMLRTVGEEPKRELRVVLNWFSELQQRVP
jgi:eukaryotic-like serine/threonine-protein kinase